MGSFGFFVNENAGDQMHARWLICWNNLGEGAFAERGGGVGFNDCNFSHKNAIEDLDMTSSCPGGVEGRRGKERRRRCCGWRVPIYRYRTNQLSEGPLSGFSPISAAHWHFYVQIEWRTGNACP